MEPQNQQTDLKKLTIQEAEALSSVIGSQIRKICDDAIEKANLILNQYSMNAKMEIVINELAQESESQKKAPAKRARKPKSVKS